MPVHQMSYSASQKTALITIYYDKGTSLADITDAIIAAHVEHYSGQISQVAEVLGVSKQTIYNWKKRYGEVK